MEARNQLFTEGTRKQIAQLQELGWYHSLELPDGRVIQGLQPLDQLKTRLAQFPIPKDLTGKRVLDIGAWDGWFSFEMERRGAEVVALDSAKQERFLVARELMNSKAEYRIGDICRLSPRELGYFDIVLFFGVLYHVKNPVLALENVCALSTDLALVESYVTDDGSNADAVPLMEFYETTELRGQFDNWVGPNTSCLLAFCRTAGFPRVRLESVLRNRAHVTCQRKWAESAETNPGPYIIGVENSVSADHCFSNSADDYLSIWFKSDANPISPENAFPRIGPYGSRPVHISSTGGDGWLLNCKLPPGLAPGWYDVTLRVGESRPSNAVRIGIDVRTESAGRADASFAPRIELLTDGKTWERYRVRVGPNSSLSIWAAGLPTTCGREMVRVRLNGSDLPAIFVSEPDREGLRQVNALLPLGISPGEASVTLLVNEDESASIRLELFRD